MSFRTIRHPARRVVAGFLLAALALPAPARPQQSDQGAPRQLWKVKYLTGSAEAKRNQKLALRLEGDRLVFGNRKDAVFSLPLAGITHVASYHNRDRHPMVAGLRTAGWLPKEILSSPGSSGGGQGEAAILTLYMVYGFVPTFAIASIVHSARDPYRVALVWNEDGEEKHAVLQLKRGEYASLLPALQRATGRVWTNLIVQEQRLLAERENRAALRIAGKVRVSAFDLKPGNYQLVLLPDNDARGQLYFIEGQKVDPRRVAAVAPVEIAPLDAASAAEAVSYDESDGVVTISQVRLPGKVLRLKALPIAPQPAPEQPRPEGGERCLPS